MELQEILERVRESADPRHVFSDPIREGPVVVIPAARLRGGAGGGQGPKERGGSGSGFGLMATPAGAFVVKGDRVRWRPALDVNRIILGGQLIAGLAIVAGILSARLLFRFPKRRALIPAFGR